MSTSKFADTHNLVAFLEKPKESDGFEEIIDFLNASSVQYALTIQALVDKKKVIITETSIRSDLKLDDAEGTNCLPTATIFAELERMGTMASAIIFFLDKQVEGMFRHKGIYVISSHTKKVFANMKRPGQGFSRRKDYSGRITPLFDTMMVQASEEVGEDPDHPTDSNQIPIIDQPSTSSQPKKKQKSKKAQRKEAEVSQDETEHGKSHVHDLEKAKDAQAKEIAALKKRVQRLERKKKSRTTGLKRLKKVGMSRRVESSKDQESLGDHEDASRQGRSIEDIDKDDDVTLVDETLGRQDDDLMFDTGVLDTDEMHVEAKIDEKDEQSTKLDDSTAGEAVTTASVEGSTSPTTIEEITLAQTLIQIKAAKPKVVTTATTTTTTRPKPEVPLKRKDQVALDEQMARDVQAQLEAELIEEEKLARKQEEEANIALIESWDNT
ncbi:hypothetical protein Tco_0897193 [Tanacetum coccineum]